jgi:16S rRNA (guanine(1405)-N(7))-methyltransferase
MPRQHESDQLDALVDAVLASSHYKDIAPSLIRSIGQQELAKRRTTKEAVKATKNKLHQVTGAYMEGKRHYDDWLARLRTTMHARNETALREQCKQIMSYHASTRERLPILDQFYTEIFALLPPVRSVLDIACGLNPLALPWMPLAAETTYIACDIHQPIMAFLQAWLKMSQVPGRAEVRDVLTSCPTEKVDVAFLLKTLPCLEQVDKTASKRLLATLQADFLVVSYPAQSLGGRNKGMMEYYEKHFRELATHQTWQITRLMFSSELVFVVKTN